MSNNTFFFMMEYSIKTYFISLYDFKISIKFHINKKTCIQTKQDKKISQTHQEKKIAITDGWQSGTQWSQPTSWYYILVFRGNKIYRNLCAENVIADERPYGAMFPDND